MAKIYCVANRKGGCAKTTTVGAMASGMGRLGMRVLVVDLDPQGNTTDWARFDPSDENTTYEALSRKCNAKDAIFETRYFDLMPADSSLALFESENMQKYDCNERLKEALEEVEDDYDVVLIDTPPALSILANNAFVASTGGVIVTTDAGAFSTKGMRELSDTLRGIKRYFSPDLRVVGILITRFSSRTNIAEVMKSLTKEYEEYFDAGVYNTAIRQSVVIIESQVDAMDVFDSPKKGPALDDYLDFIGEFLYSEGLYQSVETTQTEEQSNDE